MTETVETTRHTLVKIGLLTFDPEGRLMIVRKRGKDLFILPGGKPEPEDGTEERTLRREVAEELGCQLNWVGLQRWLTFEDWQAAHDAGCGLILHTFFGTLIGTPVPSSEIEEIRYIPLDNPEQVSLANSLATKILPALQDYRPLNFRRPHP